MTVTRFAFKLANASNTIDLAKCLSMVQRTMIRQKQTFTVLGGQVIDNPSTQSAIKISTAPNTWYVRAAVNRSFKAWKDQRSRVLSNMDEDAKSGNHVGKYADFKISLSGENASDLLLPHFTGSGTVSPMADANEWTRASVTDEAGQEKHFKILGPHSGAWYSSVYGWLTTRVIPDSEAEPDMLDLDGNAVLDYKEDFLNLLNETADSQADRLELLYEDNDNAPFAVRDMYGDINSDNNLQLQAFAYVNANNPSQMIPGFKALCGLIKVDVDSTASNPILFLDVLNTPEAF